MKLIAPNSDLIVFSLERWGSSFSRTSQIMSRFARHRNVFFIETPIVGVSKTPMYLLRETRDDVMVIEPYLPEEISVFDQKDALIEIVNKLMEDEKITNFSIWTDTPKAMPFFRHLEPKALIYDCLKDYSLTHPELEKEIFNRADVVLTSGPSLYASKRSLHSNIHFNPDCVDYRHFFQARFVDEEPEDMSAIPHPRIGFAGVIDERVDLALLDNLSIMHPEWHFILAGEVVGVDADALPRRDNIHYLAHKGYSKLPLFLASLDCSFVPYKVNDETKFLNPSYIAESLIGGRPVVATPLPDVITTFEGQNLISLAEFPIDFANKIDYALALQKVSKDWLSLVDECFKGMSWTNSCNRMEALEKDIHTLKSNVVVQATLSDMFRSAFSRKARIPSPWVHGINLKKMSNSLASR